MGDRNTNSTPPEGFQIDKKNSDWMSNPRSIGVKPPKTDKDIKNFINNLKPNKPSPTPTPSQLPIPRPSAPPGFIQDKKRDISQSGYDVIQGNPEKYASNTDYITKVPGALFRTAAENGPIAQLTQVLKGNPAITPMEQLKAYYTAISDPKKSPDWGGVGNFASDIGGQTLLGMGASALGRGAYNIPFAKQDAALIREGKVPLSKILWDRLKTPLTAPGTEEAIKDTIPKIAAERNAIEAPVIASGKTGQMQSAMSKAQDRVNKLLQSGSAKDQLLGRQLQKEIDAQLMLGERAATPAQTVQNQSSILDSNGNPMISTETVPGAPAQPGPTYDKLMDVKKGAWESVPSDKTTTEAKFWNDIGGGAAEESKNIANSVTPGSGEIIQGKNAELSSLLSSIPESERIAMREAGKWPITQVDAALAAADPSLYVAKNMGRVLQTPAPWTIGGRLGHGAGQAAMYSSPLTAGYNAYQQNPWEMMSKPQGNK